MVTDFLLTKNIKFSFILYMVLSGIYNLNYVVSQVPHSDRIQTLQQIRILPHSMSFNGEVATKQNTIGQCTEHLLSDMPDGSIIIGIDSSSCNPADWNGGSTSIDLFIPDIYSPTIYVLKLSWPEDGKGIYSPDRNRAASILFDGERIWSKRTTWMNTCNDYYATAHGSIITTLLISDSETHTLTFEVPARTAWELSMIELIAYPYPNKMKGIGYSPYRDCQYPRGDLEPSKKDIKEDLLQLLHTSTAIRTYGATGVNNRIPAIAKSIGLQVFAGAWIDGDTDADEEEIQALIQLSNTVDLDGLIVGNEYFLRHQTLDDIQYLLHRILQVKRVTKNKKIPLSTGEVSGLMFNWNEFNPEINHVYRPILDEIDFVLVHIYPFWERKSIDGAAAYTIKQYKAIQRLIEEEYPGQNKRVIIGETGWPSAGSTNGAAVPSQGNQKRYMCEFLLLAETEEIEYMYFDAFDELWKIDEPGHVGQNWGYSYSDRTAKYNFYGVLLPSEQLLSFCDDEIDTMSKGIQFQSNDQTISAVYNEWPGTYISHTEVLYDSTRIIRFIPSGFMGDIENISFFECDRCNPNSGEMDIRIFFSLMGSDGWGGIYWLADGKWEGPGINIYKKLGVSISDSIILTFWARGERGGETIKVQVGGIGKGDDSIEFPIETGWMKLDRDWKQYTIDLSTQDLSNVVGGFCWITNRRQNRGRRSIQFFLDDIQFQLR